MDQNRSTDGVTRPSSQALQSQSGADVPPISVDVVPTSAQVPLERSSFTAPAYTPPRRVGFWWAFAALAAGLLIILLAGFILITQAGNQSAQVSNGEYNTIRVPLSSISNSALTTDATETLKVNGQLQVSNSLVLTPSAQPANPVAGQLYYDQDSNQLAYYNGQQFQDLGGNSTTNTTTNVIGATGTTASSVLLQDTAPGTQQTGNFNISGTGQVGTLQTSVISSDGGVLYVNPVSSTSQQSIAPGTTATVGLTSGSLTTGPGWANDASATKVTMGAVGGTASSISVHFSGGSSSSHVQLALYDDDGNVPSRPGSLLAQSSIVSLVPDGTTTATISSVNLSANTTYWLAVNTDDPNAMRTYNGGSKASCFASRTFGSMTDPFGGCFYDDNSYVVSLNYIVGSGSSGSVSPAQLSLSALGQAVFRNGTDSTTAFQIQNAAGTTTLLNVDTTNGRIGIGKSTPAYRLDVAGGDINISSAHSLRFGGSQVLSANSDGSTVTLSNLNSGGTISVQADKFALQDSTASHQNLAVDSNGAVVFSNKTDTTAGFQIQNAAGKNLLTLDTSNSQLVLGNDGDATNVSSISVRGGDASGNNITGKNLVISAGNGTGTGGSGDIVLNTATGVDNPLVTLDTTSGIESSSAGVLTWAHNTGANPDPLLIVAVNAQATSNPATATSVTYNGVALTKLTDLSATVSAGSIWYLVNPPSGSHTVSVTFTGSANGVGGASTTFYNVDQVDPIGGFNTQSINFGTSVSTTLTGTNPGQVVFDALLSRQDIGLPTPGVGQTQLYSQLSNNVNTASYKTGGGGSTTMSWSGSGVGSSLNHAVLALNPEPNTTPDTLTEALRITQSGTLGVALSDGENAQATITLGGTVDRSIAVNQNPDTGDGRNLTIQAGGGAIGNNNGGDLLLQGGTATGSGTAGSVIVRPPSDNANAFEVQNAAGSTTILSVDSSTATVTVTALVTGDITVNGHLVTGGSAPGVAAGSAACTSPTVTISGTDTSGTITVTTGTGCAAGGTLVTATFANAFAATPHITLTPGNANAQALGAYTDNSAASTGQFTLNTTSTATDTTTYEWNYLAVQ